MGAFQSIDQAIINPWFMARFVGALLLIVLATILHLPSGARSVMPWVLVALVLYTVVFVATIA